MNIKTEEDVNLMKETVKMIKKFMEIPEIKELKELNNDMYKEKMSSYFPIFSTNYVSLFNLIIDGAEISILDNMLDQLLDIEQGYLSKDKVEQTLGDLLADKFLYKK